MKWKRIVIAGMLFAIISQILRSVEAMLTLDFYMDPNYFSVWSKVMMPTEGPPPAEFYYLSIVTGLATGIIYAAVYAKISKSLTSKTALRKGLEYGLILFLMVQIPGLLGMYMLINLPAMLMVYWGVSSLFIALIGGIVIAKIV